MQMKYILVILIEIVVCTPVDTLLEIKFEQEEFRVLNKLNKTRQEWKWFVTKINS